MQLEIYVDGIRVNTSWADMTPGVPDTPSAFYVGGTDDSEGEYFPACRERSYFDGCIDEVRISNMARPINAGAEIGRFDADKRTQAPWHFDEPEGAILFQDSSGNGNTFIGRGSAFPVELAGKLTTTLARIKSKY